MIMIFPIDSAARRRLRPELKVMVQNFCFTLKKNLVSMPEVFLDSGPRLIGSVFGLFWFGSEKKLEPVFVSNRNIEAAPVVNLTANRTELSTSLTTCNFLPKRCCHFTWCVRKSPKF